jgi:hypothetical protein
VAGSLVGACAGHSSQAIPSIGGTGDGRVLQCPGGLWRDLLAWVYAVPTKRRLHQCLERREQLRHVWARLSGRVLLPGWLLYRTASSAPGYVRAGIL